MPVKENQSSDVARIDIPDDPKDFAKTQTTPLLILVNPKSGRGKSVKIFRKQVTEYFDARQIEYEAFITRADFRAKDYLASKSTDELLNYSAIVVVSGDGLVYEVVNAIMSRPDWQQISSVPISIIPTGSGNGLAYSLLNSSQTFTKNQRDAVEVCCQQAAQSNTLLSDLVRVSYNDGKTRIWSFLSIGWGLMADIDVDSDWLRRLGEFRFTIYGLLRALTSVSYRGLLSYKPKRIDCPDEDPKNDSELLPTPSEMDQENLTNNREQNVSVDTNSHCDGWIHIEDKFACLYAVHQSHISRKTRFAPKSTPSDGTIYLTFVRGRMSPCQVIQFLTSINEASHERLPYVSVVPVEEFKLQPLEPGKIVIDGERIDWDISQGPLTAKVLPRALKLLWTNNHIQN